VHQAGAKLSREELQAITLTPPQLQSERGRPHSQSERMRIGFGNGELGVGFWRDKSPGGGTWISCVPSPS
jgi:hypothetical protein